MRRIGIISVLLIVGVLVFMQTVVGQGMKVDQKIRSAMSAAPASIAKGATIMDYPAKEGQQPPVLRKGTNAWTCFPDDPSTPGNDPMCLDKSWMVWLQGYLTKTPPKVTTPGIAYMLQGGSDASNTDPFAPPPKSPKQWVSSPAHVMLVVPGKLDPAVFTAEHHSGGPWIMWAGTPYEHLMVPVK